MPKLITDYLKRSCSLFCLPRNHLFCQMQKHLFLSQRTESDVQTSRAIHINEEKSTNENNKCIPVQCQPGSDYPSPIKQFGKKKRSCQASWFKNFP